VNAWEIVCYGNLDMWRLEINAQSKWKIVHQMTGFLLEEAVVPLLDGKELVCATKTADRRKTWTFT